MAHEQSQAYCCVCGKPTLHARDTYDVPHVFHLLATLFLCGLWLPIWIIHCIANTLGAQPPFLCTQCGQAAGQPTPQQARQLQMQRDALLASRARSYREKAAATAIRRRERRRKVLGWMKRVLVETALGYRDLMRRTAGDAEYVYWFLWVLTAIGAIAAAGILLVAIMRLLH